jgi:prolyl 4-hydroxylase
MQTLTPEVRQWIREQLAAGHARHELLQALVLQGWESQLARQALDEVPAAAAPPRRQPAARASRRQPDMPRLAVPVLPLEGAPLHLDLGDRQVAVLGTVNNPAIAVLGGFLSDEECAALVDAARPAMKRSGVLDTATGGSKVDDVRTSNGMFFQRGDSELLRRIEARIARLTGWPVENGEGIQVLQYGPGAEYRPHYDYFDPRDAGTPTLLQRGGQRVATLIMYLSEPVRGGGTVFPDVGLEVGARRGNAVFFSYSVPHPDSRTLHGGSPVLEGEKWIATKWLREREFPARKPTD